MHQPDALRPLLDSRLDARTKGFPLDQPPCTLEAIASQGWSLTAGTLPSPALVLRMDRIAANEAWMQTFLSRTGASLCPHGKTTMAPQLFHRQLAAGAWGITLATPQEVQIAVDFGVRRIILANQVADAAVLRWLDVLRASHPDLDLTVLVDSLPGVALLAGATTAERPLPVLLESGVPGGRAGCRDLDSALAVARAVHAAPGLHLRGVEAFEGIIMTADPEADRVRLAAWMADLAEIARRCEAEGLFQTDEVLLTAGGSAYFDLVVAHLGQAGLKLPSRLLLRSGCYLSHDAGHYERLVALLEGRLPEAWKPCGHLQPAMEVWSTVLSRPEAGLALLDVGKRDVSHDLHLPKAILQFRSGWDRPRTVPATWTIPGLYDQHARLQLPAEADVAVGDRIGLSISHPCTTFDKWQLAYGVDADYRIQDAFRLFF